MRYLSRFALPLALVIAASAPALAQTPNAPSPRQACMSSVITLCPTEAAARDRDAVRACLIKNLTKATPECQAAVKAAQAKAAAQAAGQPPAH
jgi:hypothetical protein